MFGVQLTREQPFLPDSHRYTERVAFYRPTRKRIFLRKEKKKLYKIHPHE
jgi:hypothetical protein